MGKKKGKKRKKVVTKVFGPYWDGHGMVFADPIRVHHRLWAFLDGRPNDYIRQIDVESPTQHEFREKVEFAVRRAFDLTDFDRDTGEGLNQDNILDLMDTFLEYLEEKKETTSSTQTLPPATGCGTSPTKQINSGSRSTCLVNDSEKPGQ